MCKNRQFFNALLSCANKAVAEKLCAYFFRAYSVGILRFHQDLSFLKAYGVNPRTLLECLVLREIVKVVDGSVVNLNEKYWS